MNRSLESRERGGNIVLGKWVCGNGNFYDNFEKGFGNWVGCLQ
ncbi:unnamed protein product [Prunus brigantina]